uniref:Putative vacuolar protein sorting-associated protein 13A isoform X7 n=1 Tax=Rhizophora mucronata TaxID=61149 RepID=A0A2P2MK29_RHIMU
MPSLHNEPTMAVNSATIEYCGESPSSFPALLNTSDTDTSNGCNKWSNRLLSDPSLHQNL